MLFVVLLLELYSLLPLRHLPNDVVSPPSRNYRAGIIHVHSHFSDGGGSVPEIAKAASTANIDFVVLTDHNNSMARQQGHEKSHGNVDIFVEMEASTPAGHCLTFFSHTDAKSLRDEKVVDLTWRHITGEETRPGFFTVIAHPSHIRNPWNSLDRVTEGIEVINFDSAWQRELDQSLIGFATTTLVYPVNNFLSALRFLQVYRKDFLAWDTMNSVSKRHFGILGHDTHALMKLVEGISLRWPDYPETFKLASNIVFYTPPLAPSFEDRKKQLYRSLREGRSAIVFQSLYPFHGNDWRLQCGTQTFQVGDEAMLPREGCEFIIDTPAQFPFQKMIKVWRNGEIFREFSPTSPTMRIPIQTTGIYRLEIWARPHTLLYLLLNQEIPYVFYNPIYVR